jgi:hypothetical protein
MANGAPTQAAAAQGKPANYRGQDLLQSILGQTISGLTNPIDTSDVTKEVQMAEQNIGRRANEGEQSALAHAVSLGYSPDQLERVRSGYRQGLAQQASDIEGQGIVMKSQITRAQRQQNLANAMGLYNTLAQPHQKGGLAGLIAGIATGVASNPAVWGG